MNAHEFESVFNAWRCALELFGYTLLYWVDRTGEYQIYLSCCERRISSRISMDGPCNPEEILNQAVVDLVYKMQIDLAKSRRATIDHLAPSGRV